MILSIYLTILSLSLIFVILGYALGDNAHIFKFIGFAFIFLLSVMLIPGVPGSLDYVSGETIVESGSGYLVTDVLTSYEDFTIGFFLSLASIFGFINCFFNIYTGGFGNE